MKYKLTSWLAAIAIPLFVMLLNSGVDVICK